MTVQRHQNLARNSRKRRIPGLCMTLRAAFRRNPSKARTASARPAVEGPMYHGGG
jgi:hypothetical protein